MEKVFNHRIYLEFCEKGFTGQNHHNGQYKSTGMGLYMVEKVMSQLGHSIEVESIFSRVYTYLYNL